MSDSSTLDALIDRWEELREQGEDVSAEELCRDCPALLEPLGRLIDGLKITSWQDETGDWADPGLVSPGRPEPSASGDDTRGSDTEPLTVEHFRAVRDRQRPDDGGGTARLPARLSPEEQAADARQFARLLVAHGKLTTYQVDTLLLGKTAPLLLDRYIILDTLDSGGMGVVFKALHRSMDRIVALKVLPPDAVDSEEKVRRFRREMTAAASLTHPNIVTAYDADEFKGTHFLVMEYVAGRNLSRVVREDGPLPLRQAVDVIAQAARGLEHAHARGIIHRDIKPANLVLTPDGTIKLLDMGLARFAAAAGRSASHSLTHDNRSWARSRTCRPSRRATASTPTSGRTSTASAARSITC